APGVHPRGAAGAGLGVPARRGYPVGECARTAAARQDRTRSRAPGDHPDRPRSRVQGRYGLIPVPLARWYQQLRRHPAAQALQRTLVHELIVGYAAGRRAWRRSLQLRMVTITLLVSGVLVGAFGTLVASRITDGLVRARVDSGVEPVREAAELAAPQLGGVPAPA